MSFRKLLIQEHLTSYRDNCYYMDNCCKGLDGRIYKTSKKPTEEFNTKDLMDMDIDYAILIWSDFADSHCSDRVVLKDRCI